MKISNGIFSAKENEDGTWCVKLLIETEFIGWLTNLPRMHHLDAKATIDSMASLYKYVHEVRDASEGF